MFTGMLDTVADVHQLTIILGHEMAHALLGHSVSTQPSAKCVRLCRCIIMYHHVIYFSTRPDAGSQSLYFSKIPPSQEFARITLKHIDKTQHKGRDGV